MTFGNLVSNVSYPNFTNNGGNIFIVLFNE